MRLGLLSDTHGHLTRTEAALKLLQDADVDHLIHCGDLGSEEVVTLLFEVMDGGCPVTAVPGNVDEWNPGLILYAKKLGVPLPRVQRFEAAGKHIAVFHGHDARELDNLCQDPSLDIVFTGHTHVPADEQRGNVRLINPGAVYRASEPGVAVLDLAGGNLHRLLLETAPER